MSLGSIARLNSYDNLGPYGEILWELVASFKTRLIVSSVSKLVDKHSGDSTQYLKVLADLDSKIANTIHEFERSNFSSQLTELCLLKKIQSSLVEAEVKDAVLERQSQLFDLLRNAKTRLEEAAKEIEEKVVEHEEATKRLSDIYEELSLNELRASSEDYHSESKYFFDFEQERNDVETGKDLFTKLEKEVNKHTELKREINRIFKTTLEFVFSSLTNIFEFIRYKSRNNKRDLLITWMPNYEYLESAWEHNPDLKYKPLGSIGGLFLEKKRTALQQIFSNSLERGNLDAYDLALEEQGTNIGYVQYVLGTHHETPNIFKLVRDPMDKPSKWADLFYLNQGGISSPCGNEDAVIYVCSPVPDLWDYVASELGSNGEGFEDAMTEWVRETITAIHKEVGGEYKIASLMKRFRDTIENLIAPALESTLFTFGHHIGHLLAEAQVSNINRNEYPETRAKLDLVAGISSAAGLFKQRLPGLPKNWIDNTAIGSSMNHEDVVDSLESICLYYLISNLRIQPELGVSLDYFVSIVRNGGIKSKTIREIIDSEYLEMENLPHFVNNEGRNIGTQVVTMGLAEHLRNSVNRTIADSELQYFEPCKHSPVIVLDLRSDQKVDIFSVQVKNVVSDRHNKLDSESITVIKQFEGNLRSKSNEPICETRQPTLEKGDSYLYANAEWKFYASRLG